MLWGEWRGQPSCAWWTIVAHKKLDGGRFELPRATGTGEPHVLVSDAIFEVIHKGVAVTPRVARRRVVH